MKKKIHVIRHGQTYGNELNVYAGVTELDLTEKGIKEIEEYKRKGAYPNVDFCILSEQKRTKQTMDIIYPDAKFIKTPLLNECNFGDFEMKRLEELNKNEDYINWKNDLTGSYTPKNGESWNTFYKRAADGFIFAIKKADELGINEYAIISHGAVISSLLYTFCNDKRGQYERCPKNGCGITINVEEVCGKYKCEVIDYIASNKENEFQPE